MDLTKLSNNCYLHVMSLFVDLYVIRFKKGETKNQSLKIIKGYVK